ncbi:hypothetical protein CDG68_12785 [Acinetobacter wuhouensis]|uniref:Uncharacterized protein n=1 Tax=Acinetobacter wuhouensis TaxID=1879050 RepID=A0A3G2T303_9GAMM|nr:hypothetical protein CDG68_12785 [Acinetobacter wuhouensis]
MFNQNFLIFEGKALCMFFLELFKKTAKLKQQTLLNLRRYTEQIQKNLFMSENKIQLFLMKKVMP